MSEHPQIRAPVETLARGVKITQLVISHAMRARLPRRIQRASPIPPRQRGEESAEVQVQQAGGRPWQGWWSHGNVAVARVSCMSMRRCAPDSSHSSISKTKERGSVGNVAVARVWRTSQTAHAIKHEERKHISKLDVAWIWRMWLWLKLRAY